MGPSIRGVRRPISLGAATPLRVAGRGTVISVTEACGIGLGHTHFGRSLLPVLGGESAEHRRYVFCEGGALKSEIHTHETDRPRENIYWPRVALQFTQPEVHGKAVMIRSKEWKYVRRRYDTDELYDLKNDPDEVHNRVREPSLSEVRDGLVAEMATWFIETGDQVPWRWDLRSPDEPHPQWSEEASVHGFVRDADATASTRRGAGTRSDR